MQLGYFLVNILLSFRTVMSNVEELSQLPQIIGESWPIPQIEYKRKTLYKISPNIHFELNPQHAHDMFLKNVTKRFLNQLATLWLYSNETWSVERYNNYPEEIDVINIDTKDCCETLPHASMLENYKIRITTNIYIDALNIWGVIRALDTIIQLCYLNEDMLLVINENTIDDAPKYKHRGLMIDTEAHYISVENIILMLDAMAMNKMNVLHWRIVGDNSFPYESKVLPKLRTCYHKLADKVSDSLSKIKFVVYLADKFLSKSGKNIKQFNLTSSKKGAFHSSMVYNESSIKKIIQFATLRGIRVIPEINIPGHLRSIAKSYPKLLTTCFNEGPALGPLDPTQDGTFALLTNLLRELQGLFPDDHFHVGGEAVDERCWETNPDIMHYVVLNSVYLNLHLLFIQNIIERSMLKPETRLIIAQETMKHNMVDLIIPRNAIIQAYNQTLYEEISDWCIKQSIILSYQWDLANLPMDVTFAELYEKAADIPITPRFIGGEAVLFSEKVDNRNFFEKVWPRTCVTADVLWHGVDGENDYRNHTIMNNIQRRIQEQAMRMALLGIPWLRIEDSSSQEIVEKFGDKLEVTVNDKDPSCQNTGDKLENKRSSIDNIELKVKINMT